MQRMSHGQMVFVEGCSYFDPMAASLNMLTYLGRKAWRALRTCGGAEGAV